MDNVEYVEKGDNIGNIAKKLGSSVDDLKLWNDLQNNNIAMKTSLIVAKSEMEIVKAVAGTLKEKDNLASV
ncbi:LysM peptidoglycan-binding domain-containing protein [Flavobacterium sp. XS2P24]|uniref:LysM peptidoglycan-binding domain-containing protein n=1 Tax=Flavobacterium sp. XS2P24 TaxID=3041249 RepID=UPI0024A8A1AF|nr:LysM peptidoglycan-binding domain-containing protein [Flavobacterium sp. XS2P24]MDI6051139.1 LysM peptidoglycan-binding domain-containing protein [Flavobacterium sp. XS2P24]